MLFSAFHLLLTYVPLQVRPGSPGPANQGQERASVSNDNNILLDPDILNDHVTQVTTLLLLLMYLPQHVPSVPKSPIFRRFGLNHPFFVILFVTFFLVIFVI